MKYNSLFSFLLIVIWIGACRKDKPISTPCEVVICSDLPFPETEFEITPLNVEKGDQFKFPSFNPNNSNEFVCSYSNYDTQDFQLIKYNIITNEKTILVDNVLLMSEPKWSKNNWISFDNYFTKQISVIKDNGDSLILFTDNGYNRFSEWDNEGNYLFWHYSELDGVPYFLLKQGITDNFPDTVFYGNATYNTISSSNKIVSRLHQNDGMGPSAGLSHIDSIEHEILFSFIDGLVNGIDWHPNGIDFFYTDYLTHGGLKKYNTNNGAEEILINHCQTKRYSSISCSAEGNKLLAQRIDSSLEYDENGNYVGRISHKSNVYLIDLVSLEEIKINLE